MTTPGLAVGVAVAQPPCVVSVKVVANVTKETAGATQAALDVAVASEVVLAQEADLSVLNDVIVTMHQGVANEAKRLIDARILRSPVADTPAINSGETIFLLQGISDIRLMMVREAGTLNPSNYFEAESYEWEARCVMQESEQGKTAMIEAKTEQAKIWGRSDLSGSRLLDDQVVNLEGTTRSLRDTLATHLVNRLSL